MSSWYHISNLLPKNLIIFEFFRRRLHGFFYSFAENAAIAFLGSYADDSTTPPLDPRLSHRWTHRASRYLLSVVRSCGATPLGDMTRVYWLSMAEIFKVPTTGGWFYLKAPSLGCAEVSATAAISGLFLGDTAAVADTCGELNCFVTKAFVPVAPQSRNDELAAACRLAVIQQASMAHVSALRHAGVPDCSPLVLSANLEEWVIHPVVASVLRQRRMPTAEWRDALHGACVRLAASAVPMTLVHGDAALSNGALSAADGEQGGRRLFRLPDTLAAYVGSSSVFIWEAEARWELDVAVAVGFLARINVLMAMHALVRGYSGSRCDGFLRVTVGNLVDLVKERGARWRESF